MIPGILLQIIIISLQINEHYCCSFPRWNDSSSFLYAFGDNLPAGNWSNADRISDESSVKKIDLEVIEFPPGQKQKKFYGVKYCQAKFSWPLNRFNTSFLSISDEEDGDQEFSYTIFDGDPQEMTLDNYCDTIYNSYHEENVGDRLPELPAGPWAAQTRGSYGFISCLLVRYSFLTLCCPVQAKCFSSDESEEVNISYILESLHFSGLFSVSFIIAVACFGNVILLVAWRWVGNIIKKRKFFEQNGGLLLKQLLNSCDANVDRGFKLFSPMEIDKATDHFNVKRILGQGSQGTVYKGMLEDGRIIAVKKSNVVDEGKIEEFINEVVILAQINHRNVVKLLGCCLETEIPLLVSEFIPNGTLSQYLHDQNEQLPLKWDTRLKIAIEVSSALSYMHSGASFSIFHRDIKSANILLDNNYIAKVADFGVSRSIAIEKTHLSTIVLGTFGYLDPEYFQSSKLTDKSDVYSFGVVLVELLTGQKPIFLGYSQENISLAAYFIRCMKEKRLYDILDDQVKQNGKKSEIMAFANLAKRCLNQNGKERPTMKEVVIELEGIQLSKKKKVLLREVIKRFSKGDRNNS